MTVDTGKGYVPAAENRAEDANQSRSVDAVFSPVRRVAYRVEMRVGQRTDYDKLVMDVKPTARSRQRTR